MRAWIFAACALRAASSRKPSSSSSAISWRIAAESRGPFRRFVFLRALRPRTEAWSLAAARCVSSVSGMAGSAAGSGATSGSGSGAGAASGSGLNTTVRSLTSGSSEGASSTGVGDLRPKGEDGRLNDGILGGLILPPRFRMEDPMLPNPFFRPPCMLFMPPCTLFAADTADEAAALPAECVAAAAFTGERLRADWPIFESMPGFFTGSGSGSGSGSDSDGSGIGSPGPTGCTRGIGLPRYGGRFPVSINSEGTFRTTRRASMSKGRQYSFGNSNFLERCVRQVRMSMPRGTTRSSTSFTDSRTSVIFTRIHTGCLKGFLPPSMVTS
mmetsp:Transcript_1051/g.2807  ORF Transcript_1051/g.2807 Transcript_1051/m.2807 type:complete len:327 (-) Transcript_1051:1482-2462(-)